MLLVQVDFGIATGLGNLVSWGGVRCLRAVHWAHQPSNASFGSSLL